MVAVMASLLSLLYFQRYRGIATGIKFLGFTLAALAFPQLAIYLEGLYGYRATLLIFGGISLHVSAACLLLKEPSWSRKNKKSSSSSNEPREEGLHASSDTKNNPEHPRSNPVSCKNSLLRLVHLLRSPFFYALTIASVILDCTESVHVTVVVDYGMDKEFSLSQAETVISYSSAGEIAGYVLLPLLADNKFLSRSALNTIAYFVLGVALVLQPMAESYVIYVIVCSVIRMAIGCIKTMRNVLLGDYFGAEWLISF